MWSFPTVDTVLQDLRYGARMMRRSPAVALIAIVSLGLGIGGAAAVFGLADVLLLQKLPVKAPEQLAVFRWSSGPVSVFESLNGNAERNERDFSVSSTSFSRPGFEAMRSELADRAEVFGFADLYRVNLSVDGRADVGNGHVVSGNYYSALGLSAAAGRLITSTDDRPDAPHVAVISYSAWQRRFGGTSVIGKQMALNGIPFTVIGVAPAGFHGTAQVAQQFDVIVPLAAYDAVNRSTQAASPDYWWILVMARLRPGGTARPATAGRRPDRQAHHRGDAAAAHGGRPATGHARARKPRADREPQLGPRAAHDDGAGHRHRAAGRLRQCRQPDARARPRPGERADRPRRDWRGAGPRGPATGDGRTAARRGRRRARAAAGQVRGRRTAAGAHRVGVHPRRCGALLARGSVHDGGGHGLHAAVRRRPGAARDRSAPRLGPSGGGAGQHHRPPAQPAGGRAA